MTVSNIEILPWDANFETGIPLVDEQHRTLVNLLNQLVTHLVYQSEKPNIDDVFEQLRQYIINHFADEERLWQSNFAGDEWLSSHADAHASFVDQLTQLRSADDAENTGGHKKTLDRIVKFLIHWLAHHILESDKRMSKVVLALASGLSLEEAKRQAGEEMAGETGILIETVLSMYDKLASNTIQLAREIQKRELIEIELVLARERAEAMSRAKSAFLANMSHELRTPMSAIMGMTALALREVTEPKQIDRLTKISRASQHLLAVINDILDISKIEADRLTLERVNFSFAAVLENIKSLIGPQAKGKGLQLVLDAPELISYQALNGDPLRLTQIFINLASNAVKFTERGAITVRARLIENNPGDVLLRCEVHDTGIGIAAGDQSRLFTAFEQVDSSMTRKYGGTGLGLSISQRLAKLMGTEVRVESTVGQGSTFSFVVRLNKASGNNSLGGYTAVPPASTLAGASAEAQLLANHAGVRVLLVEDEPINQEVSRGLLEDAGLIVDLAEDGSMAVAMAMAMTQSSADYALILMDMQMPHMNGIEATQTIRRLPGYQRTPILAMTANAFDEDRQACLAAGMNDHIAKPVDPNTLFETLIKWLSAKNHHG